MNKLILIFVSLTLIVGSFFPYWETVTIDKSKIVGNYPFAGDMTFKDNPNERVYVSTDVSCAYWLEEDEQPDIQVIETMRLGWTGLLGFGSAKRIK
jgi:hypothetical protein